MDLLEIQPIPNEPALFIKNKKMLIIVDLHIGIESQLQEQGLHSSTLVKKMINHLFDICDKFKPAEIFLLGDIKHNIPSATIQERKDIRKFLRIIQGYGTIHIIPGNHDGFIHKLASEEIIIHSSEGFPFENIGFVHGHRWPSEEVMKRKQLIIGHTHPTIMFTDRLKYRTFERCWIKGGFLKDKLNLKYPNSTCSEILVMPAFNPLCGGFAVNQDGISGPMGKIIDIQNAQIYLIDGTCIGIVKDII